MLVDISSIIMMISRQGQASGMTLRYLYTKQGQQVASINLAVPWKPGVPPVFSVSFLPHNLPLASLELSALEVQLQPQGGWVGMLRPGVPLKKLRLTHCTLRDGAAGLAAALPLLPGLEHLSIETDCDTTHNKTTGAFPPSVLSAVQQLQQLTHLKLDCCLEGAPGQEEPYLQPFGSLTRLVELHLAVRVTADSPHLAYIEDSMLFSLQRLSYLELWGNVAIS